MMMLDEYDLVAKMIADANKEIEQRHAVDDEKWNEANDRIKAALNELSNSR